MSYITGPAILKLGSAYYYFKDGLTEKVTDARDATKDDVFGTVAQHNKSRKIVVSGTPTAIRRNLDAIYPYTRSSIGGSVLSLTPEIHTKAGKKRVFKRGGITKAPSLNLSASGDLFSSAMEITLLGELGAPATDASHFAAMSSESFPNGSFDPSLIRRYRYTAAYGSSPYDAITAQDGFKIDVNYSVQEIPDDNVGIGDIVLSDIEIMAKFTPSNLTQEQIDTLIKLQDTGALQPGDAYGAGGTDLVITGGAAGDGFIVTIADVGFGDAGYAYQTGKLRAGELAGYAKATFTTGTPGAPITLAEFTA